MLFLHGWALGRHSYRRAIDALARRDWQVIVPGLPGFGGTPNLRADEVSLDGYAAWVARFLDAIDIGEPAAVVGYSFGGGVAAAL